MAWYDFLRPKTAEPVASPTSARVRQIAAQKFNTAVRDLPKGRLSSPSGGDWTELFSFLQSAFKGYPDENATELIEVLRQASQSDDDLAGSLRDLQALVNTGFTWEFVAGSRATKQAQAELELWGQSVYPGGLHVFVNNQVRECYVSGASSAEWVPAPSRKAVSEVVVVVRETVQPIRDKETGRIVYEQQHVAGRVRLHPLTFRYQPIETEGETFDGIPVAISAPATLARKTGILTGVQKIINLMARSALLTVLAPPPQPKDLGFSSDKEPGFLAATEEYFAELSELFKNATEMGSYFGLTGMEVQATPITQNASGVREIMELNSRGVWNAGASLPFLRGDVSANYALARVMYPFLVAVADNIRHAITLQLEHGANLHLRLMGISAQAFVKWGERPNAFALDDARAKKSNADADKVLFGIFGDAYAQKLMANWDIADEDFGAAPDWWPDRNAPTKQDERTDVDPPGGEGDEDAD